MKKVMIMALVLIGAVTIAQGACTYVPPTPKETAWVYKWKFTGKTTTGSSLKTAATGTCGYTGSDATCSVRCPSSLRIEGYTYFCTPECCTKDFESFAEVNEVFWQKSPFKASLAGGVSTKISNIIGKKGKQCEVAGTADFTEFVAGAVPEGTYSFTFAGLGKYDKKHERYKSIKGNFAGYLDQPHLVSKSACVNAGCWTCCSFVCESPSVCYGKWSCKFKKSAAKKYLKSGITPSLPSWASPMND